jgi:cell division septation protein DedD
VRELEKKTAAPAAAANPAAGASTVVQVLSLADKKQADAMIAKLKAQGFEPYASAMPNKAGKLRVRVRPKGGETTAALEARLRGLGFKTWTTAE